MRKRVFILFIVLIFCFGCGKAGEDTANKDIKKGDSKEKTSDATDLSVMIYDRANAPDGKGTAADNRWTNWVKEEIKKAENINLTYVSVPRSEEGTKVPVMIASQTGPDLMFTYDRNMVMDFYKDGGIHDLGPYIGKYGQELVNYITDECLDMGKNENGEQVIINARRSTQIAYNYFIRQDWLDKLGLEVPTDPYELYDVLKSFKDNDPSNVGSNNLVPASFTDVNNENIVRCFYNDMDDERLRFITDNNNLLWRTLVDPKGSLEFFKFYNKLYNDALIDQEYFVDTGGAGRVDEWFTTSKLGFLEANVNYNVDTVRGSLLQALQENEPDAEFIAIPLLKNINDGKTYNRVEAITGVNFFSPKTNKNPEAAIKYLNLLATDIGFEIYNGFEGEHFEYDETGIPIPIDSEYNAIDKDWIRYDLFMLGNPGYFRTEDEFIEATEKENLSISKYVTENYKYGGEGVRQAHYNYISPTQRTDTVDINTLFNKYHVDLTTTSPDNVEPLFAEFVEELNKTTAPKIVEERTEYYDTYFGEK
ncbi:MAG: extracellular solute-binding protein [Lachnospirales bacterium]